MSMIELVSNGYDSLVYQ